MKKLSERITKGKRIVTVELAAGEDLVAIVPGRYYQLGDPHKEVIPAERILEAQCVVWDDLGQKWIT